MKPPRRFSLALAALLSIVAFELAILAWGETPSAIMRQLLAGTWGTRYGAGQVVFKATTILFAGAAAQIALRAGLFHIGIDGAIAVSALAVGAIGARLPPSISPVVAWPLLTLVAIVAGALWALPSGVMRARFGAHEVITGIMTNKIAAALVGGLLAGGLAEKGSIHTPRLPPGAALSRLGIPGSAANVACFAAVAIASALVFMERRTVFGREVRAIGASEPASLASGIAVGRRQIEVLALSGAVAGLCASNDVMGYKGFAEEGLSSGVAFTGLAAALLAGDSALGLVLAALFFATLSQGGLAINARIPMEIVDVVVALVILFVAVAPAIDRRLAPARSRATGEKAT